MKEFRCKKCHKLLFKAEDGYLTVETICPKCKTKNIFKIEK